MSRYHQIWLGDSVELAPRFKPGTIAAVVTDPPFGVDNQSNMAVTPDGKKQARKIANDENVEVAKRTFVNVMTAMMPAMKEQSEIYVFTAGQVLEDWLVFTRPFFEQFGFQRKNLLIWAKTGPGLGDLDSWGQAIEYILHFQRGNRPRSAGVARQNGVLQVQQLPPGKLIHPHEKPTTLLRKLIEHSTDKGDWVVDPFGGSGSLVRAAEECGRNAVGIELDEYNYQQAKRALEEGMGEGFGF